MNARNISSESIDQWGFWKFQAYINAINKMSVDKAKGNTESVGLL